MFVSCVISPDMTTQGDESVLGNGIWQLFCKVRCVACCGMSADMALPVLTYSVLTACAGRDSLSGRSYLNNNGLKASVLLSNITQYLFIHVSLINLCKHRHP